MVCVIFYGCETVVELDLDSGSPKPVLNGIINPDSTLSVHISQSKYILDKGPFEIIRGATVDVYENDRWLGELLFDSSTLFYTHEDLKPKRGMRYSIEVAKEGYENVIAETTIPVALASISEASVDSVLTEGLKRFRFHVTIEDLPGENYYEFVLFAYLKILEYDRETQVSTQIDSILVQFAFYTEDLRAEDFQTSIMTSYVLSDNLFGGKTYTISFHDSRATLSGNLAHDYSTFIFALRHVSKDYYLYRRSQALQSWVEDNPFAEPVPVHTNIRNGLGIFAGYNQSTRIVRIK